MSTFGKLTDGATTVVDSSDANTLSVATPLTTGFVQSLTARMSVSSGSSNVRGLIYSDLNGLPGSLLAYTDAVVVSSAVEAEVTTYFSGSNIIRVIEDTPYWIGLQWSDPGAGSVIISKDSEVNARYLKQSTYANGPVNTYASPTALTGPIDVYVTYDDTQGDWQTLSDAIVAKIQTSTEVESTAVFDYAKSKMTDYPCITVTPSDNQEPYFADTTRRGRTYNFAIRVYQERMEQGEEESERIMRTIVDDLISIFDADIYLNTTLQGRGFAKPIPSVWQFVQGEQINTRMAEVILSCVVIQ